MRYVGDLELYDRLKKNLPWASMFIGPGSVGKKTLALALKDHHRIADPDLFVVDVLSPGVARDVVEFSMSTPHTVALRMAIINLHGASTAAMQTLLKAVEEARTTKFILIANEEPPATLASRCAIFRFSYLSKEDIQKILLGRNFRESEAERLAGLAKGQVRNALRAAVGFEEKNTVLLAVKAFRERSEKLLDSLADKWTDETTDLLVIWCSEVITHRWNVFSQDESGIEGRQLPVRILSALRPNLRPKLVVRSSLIGVLRSL